MSRRRTALLLIVAAVVGLAVLGVIRKQSARRDLREARREIAVRRFGAALVLLNRLDSTDPEVLYRIGLCEQALGRPEKALTAWEQVAPESAFGEAAAVARGTLLVDRRQFRPAEQLLEATVHRGGGIEARRALERLYRLESRIEDVRELLRSGWETSRDPAGDLKALWNLDTTPWPVEALAAVLQSPGDDDRVLLARGNLARLTGRFDEAARLFDACLVRRPDDPTVWRSRLKLGRQTDQPSLVREALTYLGPEPLPEAEALALRAWWVGLRGDRDAERRALEAWLAAEPANTRAMERLAALEIEAGNRQRAVTLRAKKAAIDSQTERYRARIAEANPERHAAEMSELAEAIGRPFDARCWAAIELREKPESTDARRRIARLQPPPARPQIRTLLADLLSETPSPVPSPARTKPVFSDDAESAGLRFFEDNGAASAFHLPEIMAGGVGVLDYDGDGLYDVFAVQGGPFPPTGDNPSPGDSLFRNRGDGTFEDLTVKSKIGGMPRGYGHGVAVGDFDDDGRPDLFVTRWDAYALYHNQGDGTFEDWTERAEFSGPRDWPTSAAWADLDGDGDLDLYVCHYLVFDPENAPTCLYDEHSGRRIYCNPMMFPACPDHLFRNDGGRFVDVTAESGIVDGGRGLGVVAADLDGDGRIDLFVANDMTANAFYRNLGGLKFEEIGHVSGVASNAEGGYHAGMGIAWGDVDGNGSPDLAVTNGYNESTRIYQNLGGGMFADRTSALGVAAPTRYLVGFGVGFLDYDDDGRLDLISANGNLNDGRPYQPFAIPAHLMAGGPDGRLADVSTGAGPPWSVPRMGRALALADLDNDGKTDAVIVGLNEKLSYFHNKTHSGNSITFRLEGERSNRDAVGAKVIVRSGDRRQVAERFGGGSYQSSSDPRLHFGLGEATHVDSVEVHWPSGQTDRFGRLRAGTGYLLREGATAPRPLEGFGP